MTDWLDAEQHADRAFEMFERGRWAEAESELRKALSLNPDQPEWHFNLGMTLEASGRDGEALSSYQRAIELMPEQAEPRLAASTVCLRMQQYADSIVFADRALALDYTNEIAYANKIDSLVRLSRVEEAETVFYLAQQALEEPSVQCLAAIAEGLIQQRQFERAGWCLREALKLDPHMPRLRARLAAVLSQTGKQQRALQLYLRDLRDDPGNIDTLLDYAELLMDLGRLSEAAEKLRRVLEMEPANVDAHYRLGEIALTGGRNEQAFLEFELVLKLDPDFPTVRLGLADAMIRRGQIDEAAQCLQNELDAMAQQEDTPVMHPLVAERLGGLLLDANMPRESAGVMENLIDVVQPPTRILRKLALARFRAGDIDGGVAASRRVLRHEPTCTSSIHNLALAALDADRLSVAAGWISRGLRVDRHDDGLRRLRARLWMRWVSARLLKFLGRS